MSRSCPASNCSACRGSRREAQGCLRRLLLRPWPWQTVLLPDTFPATGRRRGRTYPTLVITNIQQERQGFPLKRLTCRITKSFSTKSLTERETKFIPTSYKSIFSRHASDMQKCPMNLLPGNQITLQIYLQHNDIHWRLLTYRHAGIKQDFSGV